MKKQWILFDAMGVIFTVGDDTNELLVPFVQARNPEVTVEAINACYLDASLGNLTSTQFWRVMDVCPQGEEVTIMKEYLDSSLTIDTEFIEVAKKLSQEYHLAILSNDVSEWSAYLRKKFGFHEFIEESIISGDVNCRKPKHEIYQIALRQIGAKPEDCIFIDDRDKNLLPAKEVGMGIIRFLRNHEECTIEGIPRIHSFGKLQEMLHREE